MMRILLLLFLVIPVAHAQNVDSPSFDRLRAIEGWIGQPDSVVHAYLGEPDERAPDNRGADVWSYIIMGQIEGESILLGYRQVALWNGRVAGVNIEWLIDSAQARALHEEHIAYMGENGRDVSRMGGSGGLFTDNARTSRRDHNIWTSDFRVEGLDSKATLIVGDAGYRMCSKNVRHEAERIRWKYGEGLRPDAMGADSEGKTCRAPSKPVLLGE